MEVVYGAALVLFEQDAMDPLAMNKSQHKSIWHNND